MADAAYALAATCRGLDEDLRFSTEECNPHLDELASHPMTALSGSTENACPQGKAPVGSTGAAGSVRKIGRV